MDFGPSSQYAREGVKLIFEKVQKAKGSVLKPVFWGWSYLKPQSEAEGTLKGSELQKFGDLYSLKPPFTVMEITFTIHTYMAILIKLIASGIIFSMKRTDKNIHPENMLHLSSSDLKAYFILLEAGDIFQAFGLENFMDDVKDFAWILHFWDEHLETWMRACISVLTNYSFELQNQNRQIEDLFRNLYQKMLFPALRRELGEVFTPMWLAEYIIDDVGYVGDLEKRILDPACGSGTFLLEIIKKIRKWHQTKKNELNVLALQRSVVGFDKNPLAILAARVNYLWAIADLLQPTLPFTIPIFIADSIDIKVLFNEPVNKFRGNFDFIVGNPPWINWEYLPEHSKKKVKELWEKYGLFPSKGWKGKLGYAKYDISAVFVYVGMDYFLKNGGKLEFLVTQALIRGIPGRGFRRFQIKHDLQENRDIKLGLIKVHDLTQFQPFEDITTQTAIINLIRNKETVYPVPYIEWEKLHHISSNEAWNKLEDAFQLHSKVMIPIAKDNPLSRPLIGDTEAQILMLREKIFGPSEYKAREGANTEGLNCAFWIQQLEWGSNGLIHFQQVLKGVKKKILAKKSINIEPDLIFPLIRSGDLQRWQYNPKIYIIFTLKYNNLIANEDLFQTKFPNAYQYLKSNFEEDLRKRKSYAKKSSHYPFYVLFGTEDMKSPIKVCWLRMGSRVDATVVREYEDPLLGKKTPIPQETVVYVSLESLAEAHYLCAVLNSQPFTSLVKMFSLKGGKGFASPNILEYIRIPKFVPENVIHQKLANLSRKAHNAIAQKIPIIKIEEKINKLVRKLLY